MASLGISVKGVRDAEGVFDTGSTGIVENGRTIVSFAEHASCLWKNVIYAADNPTAVLSKNAPDASSVA